MKTPFLLLLGMGMSCLPLFAQVFDDFSDGNFTHAPAWLGDTAFFQISPQFELQSQGQASNGEMYLALVQPFIRHTEWRVRARFAHAPSNSNFARIYLASDKLPLSGPLRGYYLQLGRSGSDDRVELIRKDSVTEAILLEGSISRIASGYDLDIKVQCDSMGVWQLLVDYDQQGNFLHEGSCNDTTYTRSAFMGVHIVHSSSRRAAFFFDDIYAGPPLVDTLPPLLDSILLRSPTELELVFSEFLDKQTAENPFVYQLVPGQLHPLLAQRLSPDSQRVRLSFPQPLGNNQVYSLSYEGVADLQGNAPKGPVMKAFFAFFPQTPLVADVVFNELMADPSPSQGLPEVEYIELFNRSEKYFSLEGWAVKNGNSQSSLPPVRMAPGELLILCPQADTQSFRPFGKVAGLTPWPGLANEGDEIALLAPGGNCIDSIAYRRSWYGDVSKDGGGFSLERIYPLPYPACPPGRFWSASAHHDGGTPGRPNSVFSDNPDPDPPRLISGQLLAPDTLSLCFNEAMDRNSLLNPASYQLENRFVSPFLIGADFQRVGMVLDHPLEPSRPLTLHVKDLRDCWGNPLDTTSQWTFVRGEKPQRHEIVLNEVFADFSPQVGLPEAEFVELYNSGERYLELSGWTLSDLDGNTCILPNLTIAPGAYLILCAPQDTLAFLSWGTCYGVMGFPSLNQDQEALFLRNEWGESMDYLRFDPSWFGDEHKARGGWSLERIDPSLKDCHTPANWRASEDPRGGTPGEVNSLMGRLADAEGPVLESVQVIDPEALLLTFNEPLSAPSAEAIARYSISPGIGQPFLAIPVEPDRRAVEMLLPGMLDSNTVYILDYDSLEDCLGNLGKGEATFGLPAMPQSGEILINEVLFNPVSGGSDFVEIYNAGSRTVDLRDLQIAQNPEDPPVSIATFSASRQLLPGELICLTEDIAFQQNYFHPPTFASFHEVPDLPNFPDKEGKVNLYNRQGALLDAFAYSEKMHFIGLKDKNGVSLERISWEVPTQVVSNWHSASSKSGYATPGYPNSQRQGNTENGEAVWLGSATFSPDGDGREDLLSIYHQLPFPGGIGRLRIWDPLGRPIRTLASGVLLSTQREAYFWDGLDDKGALMDPGIYVVVLEVSRPDTGEYLHYRLPCVLAWRF